MRMSGQEIICAWKGHKRRIFVRNIIRDGYGVTHRVYACPRCKGNEKRYKVKSEPSVQP